MVLNNLRMLGTENNDTLTYDFTTAAGPQWTFRLFTQNCIHSDIWDMVVHSIPEGPPDHVRVKYHELIVYIVYIDKSTYVPKGLRII